MSVLLLLLMAYELVGSAAHEWIGVGMLALFLVHHALNGKWTRNLFRGRLRPCAPCKRHWRRSRW